MPASSTHNAVARQWELLKLLPSRGPGITASRLMQRLADCGYQVNLRTVQRDLNELSVVFPLYAEEASKPFLWRWADLSELAIPGLELGEAMSLKLLETYLRQLLPASLLRALEPRFRLAASKLEQLEDTTTARWLDRIHVVLPSLGLLPPAIDDQVLEQVQEALLIDRQLLIDYRNLSAEEPRPLNVHPLALIQRGAALYLVATIGNYRDPRLLAVHRMSRAQVLEQASRRLPEFSLADYVASGEPMGRAGAYAIQGGAERFVARLEGSYSGVMGLPLHETAELLRGFGIHARTPRLPIRHLPGKLLAGAATIGSGGALGLEGPSVYAGSTVGLEVSSRLRRWLAARFRFGYTEWTSTTYYEEDAAALAMLVTHADDPEIVAAATTAMDLLFLDMALHHFDGRMVASSGRAYEVQSKRPETAEVNQLIRWAFGDAAAAFDLERMSALVVTGSYRVPEAIRAIAADERRVTIRTSAGLDLHEVAEQTGDPLDIESTGLQFWLQEAFTTPESIAVTMKAIRQWDLESNAFLKPLQSLAPLAGTGALPGLVRLLNPATRGVAIQRADVVTHRSPHVQLSSAQRHHPGGFGDQQLIWMAGLRGNVNVFGTHPASPLFDGPERNFSPSAWVGNGIMPDVAQHDGVLLAVYDTTPRRGYLERGRRRRSHVHFPAGRFDEIIGHERLDGGSRLRRGGRELRVASGGQDVERGTAAGAVHEEDAAADGAASCPVVTGGGDQLAWPDFLRLARASRIEHSGATTTLTTPEHVYSLRRKGPFVVDGTVVEDHHPRFESPWVSAPRFPDRIQVHAAGHSLSLEQPWGAGV